MYSEFAVALFVGQATFARADAYQRQGRVADFAWSDDRLILTGHVRGSDRLPYTARVRLRPAGAPELVTGTCDCPVGDRCKHVGALLLEALRVPGGAGARPAGTAAWRRALDPILGDLEPRDAVTALGLQFELQPQQRAAPGRFARSAPREPVYTVAVRPVLLGPKGRWRRTGISWREVLASYAVHDWNPRQLEALRALHLAVADSAARYSVDTWLPLDRCHGSAVWSAVAAARNDGVALITGGQEQRPLVVAEPAQASVDIARTPDGLVIRPAVLGPDGAAVDGPIALLGEPAVGAATWTLPPGGAPADAAVVLLPFGQPVAAAAHAFLKLAEPIRVPRDEEAMFLAEHYRRLAGLLPVGSRDGSFTAPAAPVVTLALMLDHGDSAAVSGRWEWRYALPDASSDPVVRVPFEPDGSASFRDQEQERRIVDAVLGSGLAATGAGVLSPATGRPLGRFTLAGMATVAFVRDALPPLRRLPGLTVEETGTSAVYRAAEQAPVVSVGTAARQGDRDWFDLEIEVRVGDEAVPLADVFRALAAGDEYLVLKGGVYFPLEGAVFARLRELIAEARELTDRSVDDLRISRFQSSLWDDLVDLGVVSRQAEAWRRSVATLTGFAASGELARQEVPDLLAAELRPYQQAGYDWLSFLYDNHLGGVLADDMGLGKTVQALALVARALSGAGRQEGGRPRFLVIAPTSVVPNWAAEAHRFLPSARVVAVTETARKRGRPLAETIADADLVVTSYALARLDADAYAALDWSGLLLDEAQFVKNRASATYSRIRGLRVPFTLAITGTPLENSLMDLWSMLSLAAPGLFPSPTGFAEYYQRPIERDRDAERLAQLRRRIRPLMLRRTKEVVADELPPKLEQTLEVDLAPKQRAVYDRYLARERSRVLGLMGEFDKNRFAIFRALTVLRQVALDAALVDPAHEGVPSSKLDLLDELLADALAEGHRVLVFSQFTRLLARVRRRLDAADIGYAYLDGATLRRGEAIDRFRSGDADVFLISLKAGGFGLNLAEADYCVLLDPWWNPAVEAQAVDRAHRIGQTRSVFVYRLVAKNTIEEKVMALKSAKAELFDAVMSDVEGAAGAGITAEDVRELLG